jgi:hypothetical protein
MSEDVEQQHPQEHQKSSDEIKVVEEIHHHEALPSPIN